MSNLPELTEIVSVAERLAGKAPDGIVATKYRRGDPAKAMFGSLVKEIPTTRTILCVQITSARRYRGSPFGDRFPRIFLQLIADFVVYLGLLIRRRKAIAAENLFLRRQLHAQSLTREKDQGSVLLGNNITL